MVKLRGSTRSWNNTSGCTSITTRTTGLKLNHRQARWHTKLQEYDFSLIHKPGAQMRRADILSHLSEHVDGKEDNKDVTLLDPKLFVGAVELVTLDEGITRNIDDFELLESH